MMLPLRFKTGLIKQNEFRPYLLYWIDLIEQDINEKVREALHHYITEYEFTGVDALIKRYRYSLPKRSKGLKSEDDYERQANVE